MIISCDVVMKIDDKTRSCEEVLDKAFSNAKTHSLTYKSHAITNCQVRGHKRNSMVAGRKTDTDDSIDNTLNFPGIYFIFNKDGSKLLYLGKAKGKACVRLKQHLIQKAASTHSEMDAINEYLRANNEREVSYTALQVQKGDNITAVESELISYVEKHKGEAKYSSFINKRNE